MTELKTGFSTRRRFLLGTSASVLAIGTYAVLRPTPLTPEQKTLRSIVDTIVPSDEFAGALDVGIDQKAVAEMQNKPATNKQTLALIDAVNQASLNQYRKAFYSLDIDQRETLLNKMLERGSPKVSQANLNRFRRFVLREFYTSTQGHASLNYQLPAHYPAYNKNGI